MSNYFRKEIGYFYGIQTGINKLLLKDGEFSKLVNMHAEPIGVLTGRPGYDEYDGSPISSDGDVLYLHNYQQATASKLIFFRNADDGLTSRISYDSSGVVTDIITGLTYSDVKYDACDFLDYMFYVGKDASGNYVTTASINGVTHSTTDMVKNAPTGEFTKEFQGKVYIAKENSVFFSSPLIGKVMPVTYIQGDQTGSQTTITVDSTKYLKANDKIDVYQPYTGTKRSGGDSLTILSITGDTTFTIAATSITFTDNDFVFFEDTKGIDKIYWDTTSTTANELKIPGPGKKITGMHSSKARLLISKNDSIHKWDGSARSAISNNVGCLSHRSIIEIDGITYWFYNKLTGFYAYSGTGEPELISDPVRDWLELMEDSFQDDVAVFVDRKGRIGWSIGGITKDGIAYDNVEVVMNPKTKEWTVYSKANRGLCYEWYTSTLDNTKTLYIGSENGKVYYESTDNDDYGIPIAYEAESGMIPFDYPEAIKWVGKIHVFSEHAGFRISYKWDYSDQWIASGDVKDRYTCFTLPQTSRGYLFQYKISGSGQNPPPSIEKIVLEGEYLDQKLPEKKS